MTFPQRSYKGDIGLAYEISPMYRESRLILCGEASLRHVLTQYVAHFHQERNHQGKGNVLLFPSSSHRRQSEGPVQCCERLGGLLKDYAREAA